MPVNVCIADIIHRSTQARMLMLGFPRALYSSCASLRENPPRRIRSSHTQATLSHLDISTVQEMGWAGLHIGELLNRAEELSLQLKLLR